jgi:hypothetical protein
MTADSTIPSEPALHDVTARKVHQWAMVALVVIAFVAGAPLSALALAAAGLIMLIGRFWWPADVFRQLTWRVLEPAGILRRREAREDHETRRVARVMGGAAWLVAATLVLTPADVAGWVLAFAMAIMVALDATVDFCALCFLTMRLRRA